MLILVGGGVYWNGSLPTQYFQSLMLLYISTGGLFYYLLKIHTSRPDFFIQFYLLTIALKILAYGVYLGIVTWSNPENSGLNIVFFMVVYVIFTAIEVGFLWRKINR